MTYEEKIKELEELPIKIPIVQKNWFGFLITCLFDKRKDGKEKLKHIEAVVAQTEAFEKRVYERLIAIASEELIEISKCSKPQDVVEKEIKEENRTGNINSDVRRNRERKKAMADANSRKAEASAHYKELNEFLIMAEGVANLKVLESFELANSYIANYCKKVNYTLEKEIHYDTPGKSLYDEKFNSLEKEKQDDKEQA